VASFLRFLLRPLLTFGDSVRYWGGTNQIIGLLAVFFSELRNRTPISTRFLKIPQPMRKCLVSGIIQPLPAYSTIREVITETLHDCEGWCALQGLNLRPLPCEGSALPLS
jgi:hypothetical protein